MVKTITGDFGDNRFPLDAYNEMRRWLATWVNQELDPDKRLSAFIALVSLNSLSAAMLRESIPKDLQ